jgi:hypothetical protein
MNGRNVCGQAYVWLSRLRYRRHVRIYIISAHTYSLPRVCLLFSLTSKQPYFPSHKQPVAMGLIGQTSSFDNEMQHAQPERITSAATEDGAACPPTIDPELERRVVRKLDWRLPTLMGFLCKSMILLFSLSSTSPTNIFPDLLAFLDRSNIGCVAPVLTSQTQ